MRNIETSRKKYPQLLRTGVLIFIIIFTGNNFVRAQNELDVFRTDYGIWKRFSDAQNSLYHHLSKQAHALLDKRSEMVNELKIIEEWHERQRKTREALKDLTGPFPEKTPLNAKVVGRIKKDCYRIEHIVFESQPGFYVTSSLFIPDDLKKLTKAPAILYCSGHTSDGYRSPAYQTSILNLVNKGFIVFAFDPVAQGERIEYLDRETGTTMKGIELHSHSGHQAFIRGSSQAMYMIWDGIRAIDYLLSRKEVDPSRIGVTGRSGGGTQSAYIAAMDERIYAVASEAWLTDTRRLIQAIPLGDAEQLLCNELVREINRSDFLLVRAPKPALMITTTSDYFGIQGAREIYSEIRRAYQANGKEDNFGMAEDDAGHASTKKNREAMYAFFQKHLNNPGSSDEVETVLLTAEELRVTETGQVSTSLGGETVYSLNKKEAEILIRKLDRSRIDPDTHIPLAISAARELSGYQEPGEISDPVFTGRINRNGYTIEKYFVKGEGDYVIPYLLMIPQKPDNKYLIYLHPSGKSAEASDNGEMEWFVKKGFTVLAPDLPGIGETGTADIGIFNWYGSIIIGRSIVGIHAGDIVRLTRMLMKKSNQGEVYGLARKELAPALLHAAAFEPAITAIGLIEPYSSYSSIVMNRFYNSGFIYSAVPGALKSYDLPDLAASLAPRKLLMADITDGSGKTDDTESIKKDLNIIRNVYANRNAGSHLSIFIKASPESKSIESSYMDWIR